MDAKDSIQFIREFDGLYEDQPLECGDVENLITAALHLAIYYEELDTAFKEFSQRSLRNN